MNANKLALNRPKTKTFAITDDINIADSLSIPAVPNAVRNTNIINILGIRVSANMKLNSHINDGKKCLLNQLTTRI